MTGFFLGILLVTLLSDSLHSFALATICMYGLWLLLQQMGRFIEWRAYRVSTAVNKLEYAGPDCIEPAA